MHFRWNEWNTNHIAEHGVDPPEAEQAVLSARTPYPLKREDGKWLVWARGRGGRFLQVIFLLDDDDTMYVIHARPLADREKRRFRRKQR